jgi:hypothetical protein
LNITSIDDLSKYSNDNQKSTSVHQNFNPLQIPHKIKLDFFDFELSILDNAPNSKESHIKSFKSPASCENKCYETDTFSEFKILENFEKFGLLKKFRQISSKKKWTCGDVNKRQLKIGSINDNDFQSQIVGGSKVNYSYETPKKKSKQKIKIFKFNDYRKDAKIKKGSRLINHKNKKRSNKTLKLAKLLKSKQFNITDNNKMLKFKVNNLKIKQNILTSKSQHFLPVLKKRINSLLSLRSITTTQSKCRDSTPLENSLNDLANFNSWKQICSKNYFDDSSNNIVRNMDFPSAPKRFFLDSSNRSFESSKGKDSRLGNVLQNNENSRIMNQNKVDYQKSIFNFFSNSGNKDGDQINNFAHNCDKFFDAKKVKLNKSSGAKGK